MLTGSLHGKIGRPRRGERPFMSEAPQTLLVVVKLGGPCREICIELTKGPSFEQHSFSALN